MSRPSVAMLSEREARLAGASSNRLCGLRGVIEQGLLGGSLVLATSNGTQSVVLTETDAVALVALLREREETLLIGLNIELEG
ncbi:hypothetical protein [Tsuneonella sp. HG222]